MFTDLELDLTLVFQKEHSKVLTAKYMLIGNILRLNK